ncbi:MAG: spore maturation protein [Arcicella sp.]|nr:spore maturation protein [Arcicella sp.]
MKKIYHFLTLKNQTPLSAMWVIFFVAAFITLIIKWLNPEIPAEQKTELFKVVVDGMFDAAEIAVMKIALPLAGVMTFFMGLLSIGEKAGAIGFLARIVGPFFSRLFPEVPANHPASGQMIMNFSANMLGLDNAATPFGLKAMQSLQDLNPQKEVASNAQIMFLVLHSAGPVLIPLSIMAQRSIYKAEDPSDIFIPCLIATYFATLTGLIFVAIRQGINLFDRVILSWLGGITGFIGFVLWYFSQLPQEEVTAQSKIVSNVILYGFVLSFILGAVWKKVDIFDAFIDGAKGGFETSVKIIPYLVAMLVAISCLRNAGTLDLITNGIRYIVVVLGFDTAWVDALPTALMHPLSGGGSRAMMISTMQTAGPDSFAGRLACVFQGSSDTIFYVLALYFGSVGIKQTRYTLWAGLTADLVSVITAIWVSYIFFPH